MQLISEPSIETKIQHMQARVRWQHPQVIKRHIDQTRLQIQGGLNTSESFSFLVLGDSGTGRHRRDSPQRRVAESMMAHGDQAHFVLHTGDVVYLVGSSEQYRANFIKPYREWLVGGENYRKIAYDRITFKQPFFPVLGNHDYYDLPRLLGIFTGLTGPLRYAFRSYMDLDLGWHGSFQGDAYARAFIDYLQNVPESRLDAYLDRHYDSTFRGDRCLTYRPGQFTRVPNRYYSFRYGGIDFFALDSNTFNTPPPLDDPDNRYHSRQQLQGQREALEADKADLLHKLGLVMANPREDDHEDLTEKIEALDEEIYDIDKQLARANISAVDQAQLDWLRDRLIASWQDASVRGRIVFFHHPPYVTEATKWFQGQTLAVRHHLRMVLDAVGAEVADIAQGQPLLSLVLCGHAHCFEYLRTGDTGHGDAHIPWMICGGSGYSLRRQRPQGNDLTEQIDGQARTVATSKLFMGRSGQGSTLKRPYTALRIDVSSGSPLQLSAVPLVAEKQSSGEWQGYTHAAFPV
ncbi:MAG: metallophosphoesterase [Leptolyngbya sp. RL_3_1]|nr:metallophosphoesterase [Leptolyngbya sp. RL_3_1]